MFLFTVNLHPSVSGESHQMKSHVGKYVMSRNILGNKVPSIYIRYFSKQIYIHLSDCSRLWKAIHFLFCAVGPSSIGGILQWADAEGEMRRAVHMSSHEDLKRRADAAINEDLDAAKSSEINVGPCKNVSFKQEHSFDAVVNIFKPRTFSMWSHWQRKLW